MGETTAPVASDAKTRTTEEPSVVHDEVPQGESAKWSTGKPDDGDTAMALFSDPADLHEEADPREFRKLLWKIDFMILPYLAVCYAFFYIDKVLSFSSKG